MVPGNHCNCTGRERCHSRAHRLWHVVLGCLWHGWSYPQVHCAVRAGQWAGYFWTTWAALGRSSNSPIDGLMSQSHECPDGKSSHAQLCRSQARVSRCLFLSGCLFLGSITTWSVALGPTIRWTVSRMVAPSWGTAGASMVANMMHVLFHGMLVLPIYATALTSSSAEYKCMAVVALAARQQRRIPGDPQAKAGGRGPASDSAGRSASAGEESVVHGEECGRDLASQACSYS